jgi:hypothetical protein
MTLDSNRSSDSPAASGVVEAEAIRQRIGLALSVTPMDEWLPESELLREADDVFASLLAYIKQLEGERDEALAREVRVLSPSAIDAANRRAEAAAEARLEAVSKEWDSLATRLRAQGYNVSEILAHDAALADRTEEQG